MKQALDRFARSSHSTQNVKIESLTGNLVYLNSHVSLHFVTMRYLFKTIIARRFHKKQKRYQRDNYMEIVKGYTLDFRISINMFSAESMHRSCEGK